MIINKLYFIENKNDNETITIKSTTVSKVISEANYETSNNQNNNDLFNTLKMRDISKRFNLLFI